MMMKLTAGVLVLLVVAAIIWTVAYDPDDPERHADIVEHFKYGSIGSETTRAGVPFWIWYVLPRTFPDLLPAGSGEGYERFGFVYESPSHARPIGVSYRRRQVPLVGLNCAVCHTGTMRDSPAAPRRIVLGMPAHQLDLQAYARFLFAVSRDPRFNADTLIAAIERVNPDFSWRDRLLYRFVIVPYSRREFRKVEPDFAWQNRRPRQGPGRVDTFNPYKVRFKLPLEADDSVGSADLPPLFDQQARHGMPLHWDGNNRSAQERDRSAALGAGCTEDSIDLASIGRVEDWIRDFKAPRMPPERIDQARVARGAVLYQEHCATCHGPRGARTGRIVPLPEIGTDPERLRSFTADLAQRMNTFGNGRDWKFSNFTKTDGYVAMLLDNVWLRAPFLHNGSVPTLRDLLQPPDRRPTVFYRGYDVYDYDSVGFVSTGSEASRIGFRYDTGAKGNSNAGHTYGTELPPPDKEDLLAFLKTL
jgi:mono/diheme cytochrome c family protein